jgi:hypothetical protein
MTHDQTNPLRHLNVTEQDCVRQYIDLVDEHLGDTLVAVYLCVSAARGEMWSARFPFIRTLMCYGSRTSRSRQRCEKRW